MGEDPPVRLKDYRPFHASGCPARDPAVNVDTLRMGDDGAITTVRACTCPPERFGPGSKPVWQPGDEPAATRTGD